MKQLTTILAALIITTLTYGQNGVRECGSTYYSMDYNPTIVKTISGLPKNIQDSIQGHLLKKLGSDFYKLLNFESGLVIDYKELVRIDPKVLNYKWRVPKYDLGFYITQKQTGIKYCCSRMTLDSLGSLINNIDFPDYKINSLSTTFVTFGKIKKTAQELGFKTDSYSIDFTDEHIVIIFKRVEKYKHIEYLEISAHTGEKIRQFKVTGIIDWY